VRERGFAHCDMQLDTKVLSNPSDRHWPPAGLCVFNLAQEVVVLRFGQNRRSSGVKTSLGELQIPPIVAFDRPFLDTDDPGDERVRDNWGAAISQQPAGIVALVPSSPPDVKSSSLCRAARMSARISLRNFSPSISWGPWSWACGLVMGRFRER
jgi:hypothetical protein